MFVSLVSSFPSLPLLYMIDKVKGRLLRSVSLDSLFSCCHCVVFGAVELDAEALQHLVWSILLCLELLLS